MSLPSTRLALAEFLTTSEPGVIALNGAWGAGKTFFWREYLKSAPTQAGGRYYSYVSLFGLQSLNELKDAVFENAVRLSSLTTMTESAAEPTTGKKRRLWPKADQVSTVARSASRLLDVIPQVKDAGPLARSLLFGSVKDYVICIDDLERHSPSLSLREVLGLLTFLREQRQCRSLVILNRDALTTEDRELFEQLREKTFDYEVLFAPTAEECAAIAFPSTEGYWPEVARCAIRLKIDNIRVLFRIRRLLGSLEADVLKIDDQITEQIIQSAVLLGWCYNVKQDNVPKYEYVKSLNFSRFLSLRPDQQISAQQQEWNSVLSQYGYQSTDKLDLAVCDTLERGFPDQQLWNSVLANRTAEIERAKLENAFTEAWGLFHNRFDDNEAELVAALQQTMIAGAQYIIAINASSAVALIRNLGYPEIATQLIQHWIATQKAVNSGALDLAHSPWGADIQDDEFRAAVNEAFADANQDPRTLQEVASKVALERGWNDADIKKLSEASIDEFYGMLRELTGENTKAVAKVILSFRAYSDPHYQDIGHRAEAALRRLAAESELNRLRVRSVGLDV